MSLNGKTAGSTVCGNFRFVVPVDDSPLKNANCDGVSPPGGATSPTCADLILLTVSELPGDSTVAERLLESLDDDIVIPCRLDSRLCIPVVCGESTCAIAFSTRRAFRACGGRALPTLIPLGSGSEGGRRSYSVPYQADTSSSSSEADDASAWSVCTR